MRIALTLLCMAGLGWAGPTLAAQTKAASDAAASVATLQVTGPGGEQISIGTAEMQQLPRQSVQVHNAHTGVTENYQGVALSVLLDRVQAPLGAKLHGAALAMYVVATGKDGYRAVYSLAEVDPSFHSGTVLVADRQDGHPIGADGPYKIVNTEDTRPARWVRNLVSLELVQVK